VRKTRIEKEEIIADVVFFALACIITVIGLFTFDIHWNFYEGAQLFLPAQFVFADRSIYLWGGLVGGIVGLFLIKIFLFGLKEEEAVWKSSRHRGVRLPHTALVRRYLYSSRAYRHAL
jgi:hypothetical protein